MTYTTPVYSIFQQSSAEPQLLKILNFMQDLNSEADIRISIHTTIRILSGLSDDIREQLEPFIQSKRIGIFPDSLEASFHGMLIVRDLKKELTESRKEFARLFPEIPMVFIPRWHDFQRTESSMAYQDGPSRTLIPGASSEHSVLFYAEDPLREFLPVSYISSRDLGNKRSAGRLLSEIKRRTRQFRLAMDDSRLDPGEDWNHLIFFDGDDLSAIETSLAVLSYLAVKKIPFSSGLPVLKGLKLADNSVNSLATDSETEAPLVLPHPAAAIFDIPRMTPAFIAQFFPRSFQKRLKKAELCMSPLSEHQAPEQRVEAPRPARDITSSMPGQAIIHEQDLSLHFLDGDIREFRDNNGSFKIDGGMRSMLITANSSRERESSFGLESAFALESDLSRGLRQTLKLSIPETQISGRITNDFLQIDEMTELVLDSYIQHPWFKDDVVIDRYIPQMLAIWQDISPDEPIDLRSRNSDGTERRLSIRCGDFPLDERQLRSLLLPGMSWIISRGPESLGLRLIHGERQHINLPSTVLIGREKRDRFSLSFCPTAEYRRPELELVNGLLEHYSLRMKPHVRSFDNFQPLSRKIQGQIADPFIIYY